MTLKKGAVTTKPEIRSGPRPSIPLKLNASRRPTASDSKTLLSAFQSRKFCHETEISGLAGRRFAQSNDAVRIRIRQRTKQHRIDHAEDRGVCPDPEREGEHGDERKSR